MSRRIDHPDTANAWPSRKDRIDRPETADKDKGRAIVRIDADACEDTGVCAMVCPEGVFVLRQGHAHVVKPTACTECWICVENCVSGAIAIG